MLYRLKEHRAEVITNDYNESDFSGLKPCALCPGKLTILFMGGIYVGFQEIILRFLKPATEVDKDVEVILMWGRAAGL